MTLSAPKPSVTAAAADAIEERVQEELISLEAANGRHLNALVSISWAAPISHNA